ncbi:MAG: hypothetical protein NTU51_01850 [Bacteroidetes bacterium]|nr:hypothetical protein [Bacteroidota bacterium]
MKNFMLLLALLSLALTCFAQDYIFKTDKSIIKAKVLEVSLDIVKYKRAEMLTGPTYEIRKSEVVKIQYANGFTDVFQKDTIHDTINVKKTGIRDTSRYAIIYIVYNYGQNEDDFFSAYLNNEYRFTLWNHSRCTLKIYSEGMITFDRRRWNKTGPSVSFLVEHGKAYGLSIRLDHPQNVDRTKRFSITKYEGGKDVNDFLANEFDSFKPFKSSDLKIVEDIKQPFIK